MTIDAIVSQHSPTRSGAARFNELLAERLGVPLVVVGTRPLGCYRRPLISLKFAELDADASAALAGELDPSARVDRFSVLLHAYSGLALEDELIARADLVLCANREIRAQVQRLSPHAELVWTPGLIEDTGRFRPVATTVFSFGMAHKLRTERYRDLKRLLDASERSWALYVSNASHEAERLEDTEILRREMLEIFPEQLYFLGNLSDVAVSHYLREATFFAAFFPRAARDNNTSLITAMEHGAVVITNLDEHSPPWLTHMETVIDIDRCERIPTDPLVLGRLSVAAMEAARALSWDALTGHLDAVGFSARPAGR